MPGVFGFPDWLRKGVAITVNTGSAVATMPAENLHDPQPGVRARFVPAAGSLALTFDFGVSRAVGLVVLVNTTLTGAETVRTYLNDTDPTFSSGNLLNTVRTPAAADRTRGGCVVLIPADITARYMRLLITDISGDVLDIGSVMAMPTLRLLRGHDYGAREGRFYTGAADANPFTGADFRVDGLASLRQMDFALPTILADEFAGTLRALLDDVRPSDDVVWLPDDGLAQAELNRRAIVGGLVRPGEEFGLTRVTLRTARAQFTIRERA